jgi:hypothetical protein
MLYIVLGKAFWEKEGLLVQYNEAKLHAPV